MVGEPRKPPKKVPGTFFEKIPDTYLSAPDAAERKVLEFWRRAKVFEKSLDLRKKAEPFVFFEGPPTANGKPGLHHLFARTLKDVVCRYQAMKGRRVVRKAGWDTHGLPVELEVEKKLGISGKRQIESLKGDPVASIAEFNRLCRESIFTYKKDWEALSDRIGFWLDYGDPYLTCTNEYIESVWYLLSRFYEKGFLYEGHKSLPFCTRCGTGLSSHELGQPGGYRDIQDPSVYVRFRSRASSKLSFLAWTTTPWTLPSNAALAVREDLEYVRVELEGEELVLAASRKDALLPKARVLETLRGRKLVGERFLPLFEEPVEKFRRGKGGEEAGPKTFTVLAGDFVSAEEGTGIVHIAPAYGADDYQIGQKEGLPMIASVGEDGKMREVWEGFPPNLSFKEADKPILQNLKERGLLFRRDTVRHSYPFCWRCDTPLMYFAVPAWFLKTTAFKKELLDLNRKIRWVPPEIGEGRFGEWLEGNVDWALSRDRYWGTPLPVWKCEKCAAQSCVGTIQTLKKVATTEVPADLHRPFIDTVRLRCGKCRGSMRRVPYVIDCWFDSGAMPYAQYHWPVAKESRELLREQFPADFIAEGLDQTRGWFYTLHAIGAFLTAVDKDRKEPLGRRAEAQPAYKTCLVNGLLLDKEGRKMSKRLGNVIDPWRAIEKDGVDAIRWYLLSSGAPHLPKRFDPGAVADVRGRFFRALASSLNFFALYASIDRYDPKGKRTLQKDRPEIDRWILSRLNTLVARTRGFLEEHDLNDAAREIEGFADELSDWYIRRNRRRFWKGEDDANKRMAYDTLHEALATAARLLAPFAPFFAEMLWHRLEGEGAPSVHLQGYPEPARAAVDEGLEARMADVLAVVAMGRTVRERVGIKTRQPLPALRVHGADIGRNVDLVKDELNVKEVEVLHGPTQLFTLKAKPNFPLLGKKAGKLMKPLQAAIASLSTEAVWKLRSGGSLTVDAGGESFPLVPEDIQVVTEAPEGIAVESNGRISIALDTHLTAELRLEGLAREFVSRIQTLRKEAGLEVTDRIRVEVDEMAPPDLLSAIRQHGRYVIEETLADGGVEAVLVAGEGWRAISLRESESLQVRLQPWSE